MISIREREGRSSGDSLYVPYSSKPGFRSYSYFRPIPPGREFSLAVEKYMGSGGRSVDEVKFTQDFLNNHNPSLQSNNLADSAAQGVTFRVYDDAVELEKHLQRNGALAGKI